MEVKSKFNLSSVVYGSIILLSVLLVSTTLTQEVSALESLLIKPNNSQNTSISHIATTFAHKTTKLIIDTEYGQEVAYSKSEKLFEALAENDINLTSGMVSEPHRFTSLDGETVKVAIKNSIIPIKIVEDNRAYTINTSSNTVKNILLSCHIDLGPKDRVFPSEEKYVSAGSTIYINRATPVKITYGKKTYEMQTQSDKMSDVVSEAQDELEIPDDEINIALLSSDEIITHNQEIKVTRITTQHVGEFHAIYPEIIYVDDWDMMSGSEEVLEWGSDGEKEVIHEITFEDDVEINKQYISEKTIKESSPKKIAIGKKQPVVEYTAPAAGGDVGTASWYKYGSTPTCAHRDYPKGTRLLVTNNSNGATIVVTVNDYGPQAWTGRIIDLNSVAFSAIAPLGQGLVNVTVSPL